jgi:membrane-associated protease RseP (regulator of RpoE activity)
MQSGIKISKPIRLKSLTHFMRIHSVDVYVHWSVLAIAIFILLGVLRHPVLSLVGLAAYLGVMLTHEFGHMIVARRLRCEVFEIELYPIFAITRFQTPWSHFDHCLIAWGGVLAQLVIAVPLVAFVVLFGYTPFNVFNEVIAILGFFSLGVAVFNLLPFRPLDGSIAWGLIPELVKRARMGRKNGPANWRR